MNPCPDGPPPGHLPGRRRRPGAHGRRVDRGRAASAPAAEPRPRGLQLVADRRVALALPEGPRWPRRMVDRLRARAAPRLDVLVPDIAGWRRERMPARPEGPGPTSHPTGCARSSARAPGGSTSPTSAGSTPPSASATSGSSIRWHAHARGLRPRRRVDPDRLPQGRRGGPRPALRRHRIPALGPLARLIPCPTHRPRPRRRPARLRHPRHQRRLPARRRRPPELARPHRHRSRHRRPPHRRHRPGPRPARREGARLAACDLLPTSDAFDEGPIPAAPNTRAPPFTKGEKPAFHTPLDNFAKLRLWQPLRARGLPRRRHPRPQADRPSLRLSRVLRRPERLRERRRLPPPQLRRLRRPPEPSDLRRDARPPRHPRRLLERTDQTFLEAFFPDRQGLPVYDNLLQYVWFNPPPGSGLEARPVVHYQYEKPGSPRIPRPSRLAPLIHSGGLHDDAPLPDLPMTP